MSRQGEFGFVAADIESHLPATPALPEETWTAPLQEGVTGHAIFSRCGRYRFSLARNWDLSKPSIAFVMLNPSKAGADRDDRTVRRCIEFARREGAGGCIVVNLYAWIATEPEDLRRGLYGFPREDMIGQKVAVGLGIVEGDTLSNDDVIASAVASADRVIAAWGAESWASRRAWEVLGRLVTFGTPVLALAVTKEGLPGHPLYLKGDSPLRPYSPEVMRAPYPDFGITHPGSWARRADGFHYLGADVPIVVGGSSPNLGGYIIDTPTHARRAMKDNQRKTAPGKRGK